MVFVDIETVVPVPTITPKAMPGPAIAPAQIAHNYYDGKENARSKSLIANALAEKLQSIDIDECGAGGEDGFFVADMGEVYRQHLRWKLNLPRIEPFYGKLPIRPTS